jgi:hypothetical protein
LHDHVLASRTRMHKIYGSTAPEASAPAARRASRNR